MHLPHGMDTESVVFCYENEFYPFSNFSSFNLHWQGFTFMTSEHAYQWERFQGNSPTRMRIQSMIFQASSAHEAYKIAQQYKHNWQIPDWDSTIDGSDPAENPSMLVKVQVMRQILGAKFQQHEYVRKKLRDSESCLIVENSWRDSFWGWGEDRKGLNMLGLLWMKLRETMEE